MKVEVRTRSDEAVEERDYRDAMQINIDGEKVFSVHDGEPEDANLGRDFNDAYSVAALLQRAFEAGKNGETFELTETASDEI